MTYADSGYAADDILNGTAGGDIISGGGGNDNLTAHAGHDYLIGGNSLHFHESLWDSSGWIYIPLAYIAENRPLTNSEKNYPTLIQNISDMLFIEKPFNYLRILLQ